MASADHKLILCAIFRHYWRLKTPLDEALAKVRQTEGDEAIGEEEARRWFGQFDKGILELGQVVDANETSTRNGPPLAQLRSEVDRGLGSGQIIQMGMLPTELWVDVFSFLGAPIFMRLEWVCAHWRSICGTFFWPKLRRLNAHVLEEREFRALSHRFGSQIRYLFFGPTLDRVHLPLRDIIQHMARLEKIRIGHGNKAKDIQAICQLVPNLVHADLDLNNDNFNGLPSILHNCHRLNALELAFTSTQNNFSSTNRREFDLRLSVNRVPARLKYLRTFECGLFLPHLLELAVRDCADHLQVLITNLFFLTHFESAEVAESLIKFKNLRFLQIGIELDMLKMCIFHHPDTFLPLKGISCGHFDNELLSLFRRHCPNLEHLVLCQVPRLVGRSTYRALGHNVRKMPKLRALDVRDTAEFSHGWRLKCAWQLAQCGNETIEFLNMMVDMPFQLLLLLVRNFKRLQYLNCFTVSDFSLDHLVEAVNQRANGTTLNIGIINKVIFENKFESLQQWPRGCTVHIQKYSLDNPVELELRKIEYDEIVAVDYK